jgi:hypothetical protein
MLRCTLMARIGVPQEVLLQRLQEIGATRAQPT